VDGLLVGGASNKSVQITSSTSNAGYFGVYQDSTGIFVNRDIADGSFADTGKTAAGIGIQSQNANSFISFQTASTNNVEPTTRMHINKNGNVAIGSTVANKIFNLADPAQGGEALKLHFEASASADKWAMYAYDRTNGHYANMSFGANSLVIESGGSVTTTDRLHMGTGLSDARLTMSNQGTENTNSSSYIRAVSSALLYNSASSSHIWEIGGSEKMRLSASGRLTTPYQPYAKASCSNAVTVNNFAPLNAYVVVRGGIVAGTNSFTVPVAGAYQVTYNHLGENASTQGAIYKNGARVNGTSTQETASGGNGGLSSQSIIVLAANDYIQYQCRSGKFHGNADYNSMTIHLLG
tara:strand:- start:166 stop:1221 length:1056 start_codon:yes stop_codon:yes gene_type:complete